jgi:hypothetical protein
MLPNKAHGIPRVVNLASIRLLRPRPRKNFSKYLGEIVIFQE